MGGDVSPEARDFWWVIALWALIVMVLWGLVLLVGGE